MRLGTNIVTAGITAAALILTGLGIAKAGNPPMQTVRLATSAAAAQVAAPRSSQPAESAPAVSQQEAEEAAVAAVGGGRAVASYLDDEDGIMVWEVRVESPDGPYDVEVDAATGVVVGFDHDDDDDDDDRDGGTALVGDPAVDQATAEEAAVAAVGGGRAVASHLDPDDGVLEWEVAVVGPDDVLYEVTIDATTGDVREVDRDD